MSINFPLALWKPVFEITILWFLIYRIILFLTGTRAEKVLMGILVLLITFFLSQQFNLQVIEWLFTKLFGISVIAILVIFSPEIRQGLAQLGQRHLFTPPLKEEELDSVLRQISDAVENLTRDKIGALITIEKKDSLNAYIESGVVIDAQVSSDLIQAIFTPNNPLHDGAIIIRQGRIIAASCLFPLAHNKDLSRIYGTRHRAALGLSEETDALLIIVSEERRDISLVYRGRLHKDIAQPELVSRIKEIIVGKNA
jgi:diadenylate cyclase